MKKNKDKHVLFEGNLCSSIGQRITNDDYALLDEGVGVCVADGFGGEPLGDAYARYACHAAMKELSEGESPFRAACKARKRVEKLMSDVEDARGGTTLLVAAPIENTLWIAWYGDTAFFLRRADGSFISNIDKCSSSTGIGTGQMLPLHAHYEFQSGDVLAVCTDGVWRERGQDRVKQILEASGATWKISNELVYERELKDNSTAAVLCML